MFSSVSDIEGAVRAVLFRNAELEAENAVLRSRLLAYELPVKDSHNSSIPPSVENLKSQSLRRTRSLRSKSHRPNGGQPGHKGSTLEKSERVDDTLYHIPDYCTSCGHSLEEIPGKELEVRQSIDIPLPVCAIITNHVRIEKKCSCGLCNRGTFPAHVKSGVSYGVNIHAVVGYLSTVQHIPFKRLVGALKDLYGIEISQGSVANILNRMRKQSKSGYEAIKDVIEHSTVVGADETGERLNGKLHWMWIFQNALATYVFQDPSRGKAAIDKHFPGGLEESVLVTDRHSSYFNVQTKGHQLCLAHLLRELIYLGELDKQQNWSSTMLELLRDSIHQSKTTAHTEIDIGNIKERFNTLMEQNLDNLDKKFQSLQKSLKKHADHLFKFLQQAGIPYDNNASERGIRPLKVKQKVSGMFKTNKGADAFCQLHSIVDTARKNKQDPFRALIAVAENIKGAE